MLLTSKREYGDCSLLCFTETWLHGDIPDSLINLDGFTLYRADRVPEDCDKEKGGGVCIMTNDRWCSKVTKLSESCTPELETLFIKCCPFYSPREFANVIVAGVYVAPDANAKDAMHQLAAKVTEVENKFPDSLILVLGDFNHTKLSTALPRYKQHNVEFSNYYCEEFSTQNIEFSKLLHNHQNIYLSCLVVWK